MKTLSIGILLAVGAVGVVVLITTSVTTRSHASGGIAREPLDRLWEELMLAGVSERYDGHRREDFTPTKSWETANGSPFLAGSTTGGISVVDLGGRRWLGLVLGAGWSLRGGLLGRVDLTSARLELYGKQIVRWNGGFLGFDTYHDRNDESYEFFLLHRARLAARAEILKKWHVPAGDIAWRPPSSGNWDHDVRGFLEYDPSLAMVVVKITGLRQPFAERVDLSQTPGGTVSPRRSTSSC